MADAPSSSAASSSALAAKKSARVLACVLCQQRKIKCDRRFPCAHCVKAGVKCIPAAQLARPRRRRFPERELLDRLRHYESLLRQHNIDFEPMHPSAPGDRPTLDDSQPQDRSDPAESPESDANTSDNRKIRYEPRNIWEALGQKLNIDEDGNEEEYDSEDSDTPPMARVANEAQKVWDRITFSSDPLLFGSQRTEASLATLHPDQVQIFKFWQVYLDNVNPILKVTHIPTLQPRIINAAANVENIDPKLEALMFSIYCISLMSLDDQACSNLFVGVKKDLLPVYRFGFQQALVKCEFMRTDDLDVLAALFMYLISIGTDIDPRSLSSMLGIAVRISRRMGIHSENANSKCGVLEGEMRRRLWFALIIFDSRISEMSVSKDSTLVPSWDCKTPLNVNDFDLRPEMKTPPTSNAGATEMIFASVRCEMADIIRHSDFYLDFANPALKAVAKASGSRPALPLGQTVSYLDKMVNEKYLKYCNPENPLHLATAGMARGYIVKNAILEEYSRQLRYPGTTTEQDRDKGVDNAIIMLDADTQLMKAPHLVGYRWMLNFAFPFAAYVHIVQDLQKRPLSARSANAWESMNANYNARGMPAHSYSTNPFYKLLGGLLAKTWTSHVAAGGDNSSPPDMVLDIQFKTELERSEQASPASTAHTGLTPESGGADHGENAMGSDDFNLSMTPMNLDMDFGNVNDFGSAGWPMGAPPMANPFIMNWHAMMGPGRNAAFQRGIKMPWSQT